MHEKYLKFLIKTFAEKMKLGTLCVVMWYNFWHYCVFQHQEHGEMLLEETCSPHTIESLMYEMCIWPNETTFATEWKNCVIVYWTSYCKGTWPISFVNTLFTSRRHLHAIFFQKMWLYMKYLAIFCTLCPINYFLWRF